MFALAGCALVTVGLYGAFIRRHLLWKILALNVMLNGAFLILLASPARLPDTPADPVPQAMVLTGIVVAVSATALALALAMRVAALTGSPFLPEEGAREDQ